MDAGQRRCTCLSKGCCFAGSVHTDRSNGGMMRKGMMRMMTMLMVAVQKKESVLYGAQQVAV